jgi:hypothetical protein
MSRQPRFIGVWRLLSSFSGGGGNDAVTYTIAEIFPGKRENTVDDMRNKMVQFERLHNGERVSRWG